MAPLLRKPILIPIEGLDYSKPSTLINDRAGFPKNVRLLKNEIAKRQGKSLYGDTIVSDETQIMGYGTLTLDDGSSYMVRASKDEIEKYNSATSDWVSIADANLTGGNDDLVEFTTVTESGFLIITNGVDKVRKWTGSGNNSALSGDPPKAKYCEYLSPYLLLANVDDGSTYPWKVQWCDTGDPEEWATGNSGSEVLADEPSEIKQIKKMNEYVACYKKNSLWLGRKVATSDVFNFDCIQTGVGLASPRAVIDINGQHYFMGFNDFYIWNGSRLESFGGAVRDVVFSTIDKDNIDRSFAIEVSEDNEIWFFIVESGQSWANAIYKYNYVNGYWYKDDCSNLTAVTRWESVTSKTWADMTTTWATELSRWGDNVSIAGYKDIIVGDSDGYSYKVDSTTTNDNGTAVSGEWESRDFVADKFEFNKRWLQMDVWAKGPGTLKCSYSTDYGDNWTSISNLTLTDEYSKQRVYFDIVAERIRFKFVENSSGGIFYLRNFYPYFLEREATS